MTEQEPLQDVLEITLKHYMKRYEMDCEVALSNGFSNPQTKKLQTMSKPYSVRVVCVYGTEPCWRAAASLGW